MARVIPMTMIEDHWANHRFRIDPTCPKCGEWLDRVAGREWESIAASEARRKDREAERAMLRLETVYNVGRSRRR